MTTPEYLINDGESMVYVVRGWADAKECTALCEKLRTELKWRHEPIKLFGKTFMQPRQVYACGDDELVRIGKTYDYSTVHIPIVPWIPEVQAYRDRISKELGLPFDSCLLNEYLDGTQSIQHHSDREALGVCNSVVTISLGGSRDFHLKSKSKPFRTIKTTLHNGDVVVMLYKTQEQWTHSIPKRAKAEYRISLTYRQIKV